jgi:hypothetical protein
MARLGNYLSCSDFLEYFFKKTKRTSEAKLRSWDLWVMSPTRFHCATSLFVEKFYGFMFSKEEGVKFMVKLKLKL